MANALVERANEVIERVFVLDDEIANMWAFRALLVDLHTRDFSLVTGAQVTAVAIARAGFVRAAVSSIMACLDRSDRRENRASVGQILEMLEDAAIVETLPKWGRTTAEATACIQRARDEYQAMLKSDAFSRVRALRDEAISHLLIKGRATPEVPYQMIYELHDKAEKLAIELFEVCAQRFQPPGFAAHKPNLVKGAKTFWDTYFVGMTSTS